MLLSDRMTCRHASLECHCQAVNHKESLPNDLSNHHYTNRNIGLLCDREHRIYFSLLFASGLRWLSLCVTESSFDMDTASVSELKEDLKSACHAMITNAMLWSAASPLSALRWTMSSTEDV